MIETKRTNAFFGELADISKRADVSTRFPKLTSKALLSDGVAQGNRMKLRFSHVDALHPLDAMGIEEVLSGDLSGSKGVSREQAKALIQAANDPTFTVVIDTGHKAEPAVDAVVAGEVAL